jgi:hypothetical protein
VAHVVANAGPTRVTVIGRTDRVGAPPANMALAERRADAVRGALITAGVPADSIDTSWTGEGRQAVATADDAAEPRNRVVDITVVKLSRCPWSAAANVRRQNPRRKKKRIQPRTIAWGLFFKRREFRLI